MKKTALLLMSLAFASVCWNGQPAWASSSFTDVTDGSPYAAHIESLKTLGVTDGVASGLFGPDETLTRAQFAKFAAVAFRLTSEEGGTPFADIRGHWAAPYISAVYKAGIVDGTSDTTFSPDLPVRREEAAAMVWRYAQKQGLPAASPLSFTDKPDSWATEAVSSVIARGWYGADVTHTASAWSYHPQENMERKEMAALLDLAMKDVPGSLYTAPPEAGGNPALAPWQQSLREHLRNRDTHFQVELDNADQAKQIKDTIAAILAEDDYLANTYKQWQSSFDGRSTVTFDVEYLESKAESDYVTAQAKAIVAQIVKPVMNDFQKEKAVHDYVVTHIAYDESFKEYTAYSALTKGTAVCQGYALLTYRLLQEAGLPNKIAVGYAGGQSHAWNLVLLDGNWYHLDTTWDDPVPDEKGRVLYNYFNLTDSQLRKDHSWKDPYPAADTDFVSVLNRDVQSGGADAASARTMLDETGLTVETAAFTADTKSGASAIVEQELAQGADQIRFRYKSSLGSISTVIGAVFPNDRMLQYRVGNISYSNAPDTRSTGYTVVTVDVTYE